MPELARYVVGTHLLRRHPRLIVGSCLLHTRRAVHAERVLLAGSVGASRILAILRHAIEAGGKICSRSWTICMLSRPTWRRLLTVSHFEK